jgi:hypothetical protein
VVSSGAKPTPRSPHSIAEVAKHDVDVGHVKASLVEDCARPTHHDVRLWDVVAFEVTRWVAKVGKHHEVLRIEFFDEVSARPANLETLQREAMHQTPGNATDRRREATRTLTSADEFRKTAQLCRADALRLPVISNLHEAARLAITAVAASRGLRFANRPAAHVAVVDFALAIQLVNRTEWAQLDELRDLRHKTNLPLRSDRTVGR